MNFVSEFCFHSARAGETPTAHGLKHHKASEADENKPQPPDVKNRHAAREEDQPGDAAAHEASARINVGLEKTAHARMLARGGGKASSWRQHQSSALPE